MLLRNVLKGEHFIVSGKVLYRKTEAGYMLVGGIPELETPDTNTEVKIVNPWNWFAKREKDD